MHLKSVRPDHPDVKKLIAALDDYQSRLYPAESNHLDGLKTLKSPNVIMAGVLDAQNSLMGIGAVKCMDGYGEIKRMFVSPSHRKKGIATILLKGLEHYAMAKGLGRIRLETGIHQKGALALYRSHGFRTRGPFGEYGEDPLSVFMEKDILPLSDILVISPYTREDRDQVVALWESCGLTTPWNDPDMDILRKTTDSPALFFIARLEDQVIGSCMAGYDGHRGSFNYLGVGPEFRHRGVAARLIQQGETALTALGCPKINLMIRKTNTEVKGFYKDKGYEDDPVLVLGKRLIPDL